MNARILLKVAVFTGGAVCAFQAAAEPPAVAVQPETRTVHTVLASLDRELAVPVMPNMSRRIAGPDIPGQPGAAEAEPIQVAGRCGSSQYYCDSPGFTYCCGNSTDGYYCAANVNGCTK